MVLGRTVYLADLYIRALTPLFTVAAGLFVLARSRHSRSLGIFAVGFLGLVVLANLYDLENLAERFGIDTDHRRPASRATAPERDARPIPSAVR